jgi:hypothetical protein
MMPEALSTGEDRSLGELLGDLTREMTTLLRHEVTLARTEMTQKAARVGKDVGMLAAGGAVAYAGLFALLAALIGLLAHAGMPWWGAALLVGVVVTAIGGWLVQNSLAALRHVELTPQQTLESLKEEKSWINKQAA